MRASGEVVWVVINWKSILPRGWAPRRTSLTSVSRPACVARVNLNNIVRVMGPEVRDALAGVVDHEVPRDVVEVSTADNDVCCSSEERHGRVRDQLEIRRAGRS